MERMLGNVITGIIISLALVQLCHAVFYDDLSFHTSFKLDSFQWRKGVNKISLLLKQKS